MRNPFTKKKMAELAQFRASTERFETETTYIIPRKDLSKGNEIEWRKINEVS